MESWHELERDDEYGDWLNLDEAEAAINALPAASLPAAWGREELAKVIATELNMHEMMRTQTVDWDEAAQIAANIALSRPLPPFTDEMVEAAHKVPCTPAAPIELLPLTQADIEMGKDLKPTLPTPVRKTRGGK